MNKPIAIIAGETNSISSEIIFKAWKIRKKFKHKLLFVIGSIGLLDIQKKKLNYSIKLKEINDSFNLNDLKGDQLPVYNVNYNQKIPFKKISSMSNNYIFTCFDKTLNLIKKRKIVGFINCPVSKEYLFKNKHQGVTEFLAKKSNKNGKEVMLIYNKELSVAPMTTHISLNQVSLKLDNKIIVQKVLTINAFYKNTLKKKPKFAILGLNPHNFSTSKKSEENEIITKSIKKKKKIKINVEGPIPTDSSFMIGNKSKFDVIIGMYHDQVLTPFKALYNYQAINITLGLPYIRISPDHGTAQDIAGYKKANPTSLVESIRFFNNIK